MAKTKLVKSLGAILHRKAPEILLGTGIAGMVTTVILAVRATPEAMLLIDDAQVEKGLNEDSNELVKLTPIDVVKATWKCYIPTVLIGSGSIICLVCAHSTNARRNAALAAAYSLSETALKEYQAKVIETIGEKKEQAIQDAVNKDRVAANPPTTQEIIITSHGDTLCYDHWSGRYFKSDVEKIRKAANKVSRRMLDEVYISLNDFYSELGLSETRLGDELGWNVNREGFVEVKIGATLADGDIPCIVLDYVNAPTYDYMR